MTMTDPTRTVFCPACAAEVSRNAETCPRCGEPIRGNPAIRPHATVITHILIGVTIGALLLWFGLRFLRALNADLERQTQRLERGSTYFVAPECPKIRPEYPKHGEIA